MHLCYFSFEGAKVFINTICVSINALQYTEKIYQIYDALPRTGLKRNNNVFVYSINADEGDNILLSVVTYTRNNVGDNIYGPKNNLLTKEKI